MVQTFYVWRIYNLTKNIWICILIEVVAVAQCVLAYYYGIVVGLLSFLASLSPKIFDRFPYKAWVSVSSSG